MNKCLFFFQGLIAAQAVQAASLLASHFSGKLYSLNYEQNEDHGTLSVAAEYAGCGITPGWISLYPERRSLWCFDEAWTGRGVIAQYEVTSDGVLSLVTQFQTSGNDVHGRLYGGVNGTSFIASAQYSPSSITTYKLPTSSSNPILQLEKFAMAHPGPNPRQDVPHPHEIILDPTGDFMIVPDLGADALRIFRIDMFTGQLFSCGTGEATPGDGPRHGAWFTWDDPENNSSSTWLYTLNELGNSVSVWSVAYDQNCISVNMLQTMSTYSNGQSTGPNTKAAELRIFGNFLYASNRGDESFGVGQDSMAIFKIASMTGRLSWLEAANTHVFYPRTFQINRAGNLVAIGGQTSSDVAIVERDIGTGKLGKLISRLQIGNLGRPGEEDGLSAVVWNE